MKKALIVLLFVAFLPTSVYPQNPRHWVGYLDVPTEGSTVSRYDMVLKGWVFDCNTGEQPDLTDTSNSVTTALWHPDYGWWRPSSYWVAVQLPRPDVYYVYAPYCPALTPSVGYHLYIDDVLPTGTWTIWITWATRIGDTYSSHSESRTITITE